MFTLRPIVGAVPTNLHGTAMYELSTVGMEMIDGFSPAPNGNSRFSSSHIDNHMTGLDDLLLAYPELCSVRIFREPATGNKPFKAFFSERYGQKHIEMCCKEVFERDTFLHEIQHAIQTIDGRCNGSNGYIGQYYADMMVKEANDVMQSLAPMVLKLAGQFNLGRKSSGMAATLKAEYKAAVEQYKTFSWWKAHVECYRANQGEVEARLTEARSYLPANELASTPFVKDYDERYFNTFSSIRDAK